MQDPQVIIVGAGAAGIGAGLELAARGVSFVILEAALRIGGRAFTDCHSLPAPWDHGCHWLHSADINPLVAWADRLGASYSRDDDSENFTIWQGGHFASAAEIKNARAASLAAFAASDAAAQQRIDVPMADVLPDAGRWQAGVHCMIGTLAGDDARAISTLGFADFEDTGLNWPVRSGYGALIAEMAAGLPVRLNTPVTRIAQGAQDATVTTPGGALKARAVIVTVSTNVLTSGVIRFDPGPAAELLPAIADIPCGAYEKVAFALRHLPAELAERTFCTIDPGPSGPAIEVQIVPGAAPMLIAHVGGETARVLSAKGAAALIDAARGALLCALGADFRKEIVNTAASDWTQNPWVRGSYSHARTGTARRRHQTIAAETGTVAFAGEAFSLKAQATAHGAYQNGRDVAARLASDF